MTRLLQLLWTMSTSPQTSESTSSGAFASVASTTAGSPSRRAARRVLGWLVALLLVELILITLQRRQFTAKTSSTDTANTDNAHRASGSLRRTMDKSTDIDMNDDTKAAIAAATALSSVPGTTSTTMDTKKVERPPVTTMATIDGAVVFSGNYHGDHPGDAILSTDSVTTSALLPDPSNLDAPKSSVPNANDTITADSHNLPLVASITWSPLVEEQPWAAICAVMKDEDLYIDDWTDYHLALGFQHIFVYDNHPNFTLASWYEERQAREARAAPHHDTTMRRVHLNHRVIDDGKEYHQFIVYDECLDELRALSNPPKWVLVIDGDEYLVFRDMDKYPNAVTFLTEHCQSGSLQFSWVVMGSSYELHYRNEPDPKRFQMAHVDSSTFWETKAVAVLDHVKGWHVHNAVHKPGYFGIGMGGRMPGAEGFMGAIENGDTSVAAVFHYKYKSYDEFNYKHCVRGDINFLKKPCPTPGNTGSVHDDGAWKAMQRLLPQHAKTPLAVDSTSTDEHPSAALCAIVRHESDARYLSEWTDYHLALGFDHIYIFDSQTKFTLPLWYDQWNNEHRDRVHVTHRFMPSEWSDGSEIIYRECMNEFRLQPQPPKYVMALDINDFLVVRDLDRYPNVTSFLKDRLQSGSLQISWIVMGSANEAAYHDAPVTQRFRLAMARGLYSEGKPVAVLDHIEGLQLHNALHKPGYNASSIENGDVTEAAIYHYKYKSKEEYRDRQCRSADAAACIIEVEAGTVWDDSAWLAMTRLVAKYNSKSDEW